MHILQSQWLRALTSNDVYFFELQLHKETHKDHDQFMQTHILGRLHLHDSDQDTLNKTHKNCNNNLRRYVQNHPVIHFPHKFVKCLSFYTYSFFMHRDAHLPITALCLHTIHQTQSQSSATITVSTLGGGGLISQLPSAVAPQSQNLPFVWCLIITYHFVIFVGQLFI